MKRLSQAGGFTPSQEPNGFLIQGGDGSPPIKRTHGNGQGIQNRAMGRALSMKLELVFPPWKLLFVGVTHCLPIGMDHHTGQPAAEPFDVIPFMGLIEESYPVRFHQSKKMGTGTGGDSLVRRKA